MSIHFGNSCCNTELNDLLDVIIEPPIIAGEYLCYNGTEWVNSQIQVEELKPPIPQISGRIPVYNNNVGTYVAQSAPISNGQLLRSNNVLDTGLEWNNNEIANIGINSVTSYPLTVSDTNNHNLRFNPMLNLNQILSSEKKLELHCDTNSSFTVDISQTGTGTSGLSLTENSSGYKFFFRSLASDALIEFDPNQLFSIQPSGGLGIQLHSNGKLESAIPNYEAIVDTDNTFITRKYLEDNPGTLDDLKNVETNGGMGTTIGDRLTYAGITYPFINASNEWTNISIVSGAISFEDFTTPLVVVNPSTYTIIPFAGILQPDSFLITTNGSGRLTNVDDFTWAFQIVFSCSLTGNNNTEFETALHINGVKVSNPYLTTVSATGRYVSILGIWTQNLNGNSFLPPAIPNHYAEIYIRRNTGVGDATIGSVYLAVQAVKLQNRPIA